ncbi:universal stress protein [Lysobacter sp. CCNWLW3]|uniref:universal stress protein n=1 Tax=unclassified Lysobacter TaxID=2635362 RepID=UPI002FD08BC9
MYKDLMIPMTGTSADADALALAMALAKSHGAHLSALEIVDLPMPMLQPWGMMPDAATYAAHASLREHGAANLARLQSRLSAEPVSSEAKLIEALYSEAPRVAARQAYDADLTVVAGAIGDTAESVVPHAYFVSLLLESGRPVIVVPPRWAPTALARFTIAWQPTQEASRAIHDALPLLRNAERVDVLTIGEESAPEVEASGQRIVRHLGRHGIDAHRVVRPRQGLTVAAAILRCAGEVRSQALIAGGYGHSRLREWVLGGVTRELLIGADIPLFFGH